jgi:hypothetical protein
MSIQQIVAIALRLSAIWLLMITVQLAAISSVVNKSFGNGSTALLYILPAVPLLLAVFLWRFPMFTARRLLPRGSESAIPRMAPRDAIIAASVIIGLWALIGAIPRLFGAIGLFIAAGPERLGLAPLDFYFGKQVDLLATLVQCLLGVFLVAKPWYVAELAFRAVKNEPQTAAHSQ